MIREALTTAVDAAIGGLTSLFGAVSKKLGNMKKGKQHDNRRR